MKDIVEVDFLDIEQNEKYIEEIEKVIKKCFEIETLNNKNLYVSITLTNPENIRKINKEYRNIDNETDVLSFPMFEKEELCNKIAKKEYENEDILGDIVISIKKVEQQAIEYGHSFQRELSYMLVHGFYHLMGEDHIKEEDKKQMRKKEEIVLNSLAIARE